jgi:16S rRNA (cytosine1402-N4)-methyltransferase
MCSSASSPPHQPIMVEAILSALRVEDRSSAIYVDGTVGAGGHSRAILNVRPDSQVMGMDRDPYALELATQHLAEFGERVHLVHRSYMDMDDALTEWLDDPRSQADGVLLDLGVSSMQFDTAERGFAFRLDGTLDMRFDPTSDDLTAADLVNELPADALADILFQYGEERNSRKIASAIVDARPITTTVQLAELIASINRNPREKIHPATRSFQALRIAVNQELQVVEDVLPIAIQCLKQGGRLGVITFHSLEDRIVKRYFKEAATDCICPPRHPICTCNHQASVKLITRKPMMADVAEVERNPRSRSAKLRVIEKL